MLTSRRDGGAYVAELREDLIVVRPRGTRGGNRHGASHVTLTVSRARDQGFPAVRRPSEWRQVGAAL